MRDVRGDVVRRQLMADHGLSVATVRSICGYLIHGQTPSSDVAPRVDDLFADPIIEHGLTNTMLVTTDSFTTTPDAVITVGFKPGVTDNPGTVSYTHLTLPTKRIV